MLEIHIKTSFYNIISYHNDSCHIITEYDIVWVKKTLYFCLDFYNLIS